MKKNKFITTSSIGLIVIVLAIVVFYLMYFMYYIPAQELALRQRAFRILKEYANNMTEKYEFYNKQIDNYGIYYYISLTNKKKDYSTSLLSVINSLDKTITLDTVARSKCHIPFKISKEPEQDSNLDKSLHAKDKKIIIKARESLNIKDTILYLPYISLMEGLKYDHLLDNIILFDSSKIIYNSSPGQVQDITDPKLIHDTVLKRHGGYFDKVEVSGHNKYMIVVPLNFLGEKLFLAGYITEENYSKITRGINYPLLIIISAILLLVLIGIPVIKVIFINRYDRLRVRDATNATISLLTVVGMLVIIGLSIFHYSIYDFNNLYRRLITISETLNRNVIEDINLIIELNDEIVKNEQSPNTHLQSTKDSIKTLAQSATFSLTQKPFNLISKSIWQQNIPVNEILLADSTGIITGAFTHTPFSNIVPIDIGERDYFRNALNPSKSWYRAYSDKNEEENSANYDRKFFIQSIKSYNTLDHEAAVSFPIDTNTILAKKITPIPKVLAITSHIPSLFDQVLPDDVHFMVIDMVGKVLFHSDQANNLHENFLDECKKDAEIISTMRQRTSHIAMVDYNESKWLARIVPIKDTPLYHVTLIAMEYTQNKNSRIFLFTFYFLIATLVCIIIGMQFMQRLPAIRRFIPLKEWSFKWLLFRDDNYFNYSALIILQSILFIGQMTGLLFIDQPVIMWIYQLSFISFSGFASYILLNKKSTYFYQFFNHSNLVTTVMFSIIVLLLVLVAILKTIPFSFLLLILSIVTGLVLLIQRVDKRKLKFTVRPMKYHLMRRLRKYDVSKYQQIIRRTYHYYMFLWLVCLVVVPVYAIYNKVSWQERKLWKRYEWQTIAQKNIDLMARYDSVQQTNKWYSNIQGNDIDNMKIEIIKHSKPDSTRKEMDMADNIYSQLPDPITGIHFASQLKNNSYNVEWLASDKDLKYSRSGQKGRVMISNKPYAKSTFWRWLLITVIPFIFVLLLVWKLYHYLADQILNTVSSIWVTPEIDQWETIIHNPKINRILLISYYPEDYLAQFDQLRNTKDGVKATIFPISINDMTRENWKLEDDMLHDSVSLWITGLSDYVRNVSTHELIMLRLIELNHKAKGRIVLCIPFEPDYIPEIYDEFLSLEEVNKDQKVQIYMQEKNWDILLGSYYKFTGKLNLVINPKESEHQYFQFAEPDENHDEKLFGIQNEMESRYNYIWDCLSTMEKVVILDIAEDGMLNLRNKFVINRLVLKGLIIYGPYPRIFSESFRYFIRFSLKPGEYRKIEDKMKHKGKWRSTRFLILMVLVPVAGFVLISQGLSIEKVLAIFTGVLAILGGTANLLNSGSAKASSA
jgi:hypothetical protein